MSNIMSFQLVAYLPKDYIGKTHSAADHFQVFFLNESEATESKKKTLLKSTTNQFLTNVEDSQFKEVVFDNTGFTFKLIEDFKDYTNPHSDTAPFRTTCSAEYGSVYYIFKIEHPSLDNNYVYTALISISTLYHLMQRTVFYGQDFLQNDGKIADTFSILPVGKSSQLQYLGIYSDTNPPQCIVDEFKEISMRSKMIKTSEWKPGNIYSIETSKGKFKEYLYLGICTKLPSILRKTSEFNRLFSRIDIKQGVPTQEMKKTSLPKWGYVHIALCLEDFNNEMKEKLSKGGMYQNSSQLLGETFFSEYWWYLDHFRFYTKKKLPEGVEITTNSVKFLQLDGKDEIIDAIKEFSFSFLEKKSASYPLGNLTSYYYNEFGYHLVWAKRFFENHTNHRKDFIVSTLLQCFGPSNSWSANINNGWGQTIKNRILIELPVLSENTEVRTLLSEEIIGLTFDELIDLIKNEL